MMIICDCDNLIELTHFITVISLFLDQHFFTIKKTLENSEYTVLFS